MLYCFNVLYILARFLILNFCQHYFKIEHKIKIVLKNICLIKKTYFKVFRTYLKLLNSAAKSSLYTTHLSLFKVLIHIGIAYCCKKSLRGLEIAFR